MQNHSRSTFTAYTMRIELNINTDGSASAQPTLTVSPDNSSTYSTSNTDSNYSSHSHLHSHDIPGVPHPMQMSVDDPTSFYPVDPKLDIGAKPWVKPAAKPLTFISKGLRNIRPPRSVSSHADFPPSDANIVEPASGKLLTSMTLKTKDGKITSLSKTSSADRYEYVGQVIDAKDYYLCPGLIDCECCLASRKVVHPYSD